MARIQLENVKKSFGKVQALNGINIDVKDKEFLYCSDLQARARQQF